MNVSSAKSASVFATAVFGSLIACAAEWFDAGISGYDSWPADGSDKVVDGVGTWRGTGGAALDAEGHALVVNAGAESPLSFAPAVSRDVQSVDVAWSFRVSFHACASLPGLDADAKCGLVAYADAEGSAFYGVAKDPDGATNTWARLSGAVPGGCAETNDVSITLKKSGDAFVVRYEVDGTTLLADGAEDIPVVVADSVTDTVDFTGYGNLAGLSATASESSGDVSLSFAEVPNMTVASVTVGGVAVNPTDGVYVVPAGSSVTVTFAPAAGYALSATSATYVPFGDTSVAAADMPQAVDVAANVRINEVMASNGDSLATANGGVELDWVELRNDGDADADLAGWYIGDDPTKKPSKWVAIEGSCVVPAHGFKIVWCDKTYTNWAEGEAHAAFGVGKSGGTLFLADAASTSAIRLLMELPAQIKDVSYGLGQREETVFPSTAPAQYRVGGGAWRDCEGPVGMPGETNGFKVTSYALDKSSTANISAVEAAIASGKFEPARTMFVDCIAYSNSNKNVKTSPQFSQHYRHFATHGVSGNYYALLVEGVVWIPRAGSWTFSVGSDDGFSLRVYNGKYSFESEFPGGRSYGQTPAIFGIQEPGAYNVRLLYFQGTGSAALDFSVKEGEFEDYETFTLDGFQLVGLSESGVTHAGEWAGQSLVDVSGDMLGVSDTLEWRKTFTLAEAPTAAESYRLKVRYADGFAVSVNGTPVASVPAAGQRALADAILPAVVEIPSALLAAGENTVEVAAYNDDAGSAEFLLAVEATVTTSGEGLVYFREPTPNAPNTTAGYGPASPKVAFSEPHGWKTEPFELSLSCPADGSAEIYYTLDGTSPTTNSTRYTAPIQISSSTCVRAAVPREGSVIQQDASATYLFLEDVLAQTRGVVPDGFPANKAVNDQVMLYGMNQSVVNGSDRDRLLRGFTNSVATMSIVIDPANLFDKANGIYVNAKSCDGRGWERLTMVEQFDPKDPANGFSTAAGIRVRGAFSRNPKYPKHSLRLFFRNDYGDGALEFPLFGDEGAGKYKKVDLRTSQNYAWANGYDPDTFIHEVFSRDSQRDMGDLYTRSRYYNLFINGQYWGLYQTQERGDNDFAETYNGGDADLYDVIKTSQPGYVTGASEGTIDAWEALWNMAVHEGFTGAYEGNYRKAMGLNPDGTRNPEYPVYLNPTNLMDYMICSHYVVDSDTPSSRSNFPNNLYAVRDRVDDDEGLKSQGFFFLRHDAEHSMGENTSYTKYTDDPTGYGTTVQSSEFTKLENFNPAELHYKLCENAEYRQAFADRFYWHCLREGGAFTVEKATERFTSRMAEIDDVIVCEAARWATKGQTRQTWLDACGGCLSFITNRMPYMLSQYRARGWYPSVAAPAAFDADGARIAEGVLLPGGATVKLMNSETDAAYDGGTVWYTLDGGDPRAADGSVSEGALACSATGFALPDGGATVTARYLSESGEWSALATVALEEEVPSDQALGVRVAAVYSSTADGGGDGSEFIVFTNILDRAVSLEGLRVTCTKAGNAASSLDIALAAGREIAANGTVTLTKSADWPSAKITNGSVDMMVYDSAGKTVQTLRFDAGWWPVGYTSKGKPIGACDGTGAHFVALEFGASVTAEAQWSPSFTPPASDSPGYAAVSAAAADERIRTWLDGLAQTDAGYEAITNFAGSAGAVTACFLVGLPLEDDPEVVVSIPDIHFDADGNVVVGGAVSSHGVQLERGIVGELRLYRSATLEGLPASTDYISLGYTVPVDGADAGKAGAAGFFQLRIE